MLITIAAAEIGLALAIVLALFRGPGHHRPQRGA